MMATFMNVTNSTFDSSISETSSETITNVKVGVIGVGYVGIHLVTTFAKHYQVSGYDVSPKRVKELGKELKKYENVQVDYKETVLEECDVFLISVPTLLRNNQVDTTHLESAIKTVKKYAKQGNIVVMESSVSVGMTRDLLMDLAFDGVHVGFSPERVDPGRLDPQSSIPKVVSGHDKQALDRIVELYSTVFEKVVPVSSLETAEMCKLYENCFRMINIAYVNEIADSCHDKGINVHEVIQASATKPFGFMPFYPGVGIGGHCIPVNPYYLFSNNHLPLLNEATKMVEKRPVQKAKKYVKVYPNHKRVLVVGVGFKPGQSVLDHSPGLSFANALKEHVNVMIFDPLVDAHDHRLQNHELITDGHWKDSVWINSNFDGIFVAMKQTGVDWKATKHFYIPVVYGNHF